MNLRALASAVICLIVGILLGMLVTCGPRPVSKTTISYTHDTIWPDTVFKEVITKVKGPVRTYTVFATDSVKSLVNVYNDTLRDSSVVITYQDSINGTLLGKKLSYKLLVPLRIIDSVFIKTTETLQPARKGHLFVGGGAAINRDILPALAYQFPNGREVLYQYSTLHKSHIVSVLVPISLKRK